ncbi:MAG TPA: helix-turn-helix domain-containing protein, partial [Thermoanaerobaculia bacterium]|nr:helix-turn-helix domain-containing protein [Thermoanaerobaculia bacterium]
MENEPHNEPYAVADGVSDDPPEDAAGETHADHEPELPVEAEPALPEEASPATPGGEIGRRPMRSGAEAGAGAALAEAGSAAGPPGEGAFGAWLRRQREIREIDLREIADKTKISLRYLKAMEQDRFEVLPAPIFARGFLREYARYVGLDADEVVNYYLAAHHPAGDDDAEEALSGSRRLRG